MTVPAILARQIELNAKSVYSRDSFYFAYEDGLASRPIQKRPLAELDTFLATHEHVTDMFMCKSSDGEFFVPLFKAKS
jgi:hypothetical protein